MVVVGILLWNRCTNMEEEKLRKNFIGVYKNWKYLGEVMVYKICLFLCLYVIVFMCIIVCVGLRLYIFLVCLLNMLRRKDILIAMVLFSFVFWFLILFRE